MSRSNSSESHAVRSVLSRPGFVVQFLIEELAASEKTRSEAARAEAEAVAAKKGSVVVPEKPVPPSYSLVHSWLGGQRPWARAAYEMERLARKYEQLAIVSWTPHCWGPGTLEDMHKHTNVLQVVTPVRSGMQKLRSSGVVWRVNITDEVIQPADPRFAPFAAVPPTAAARDGRASAELPTGRGRGRAAVSKPAPHPQAGIAKVSRPRRRDEVGRCLSPHAVESEWAPTAKNSRVASMKMSSRSSCAPSSASPPAAASFIDHAKLSAGGGASRKRKHSPVPNGARAGAQASEPKAPKTAPPGVRTTSKLGAAAAPMRNSVSRE